jgi:hypothetical protein
MLDIVAELRPDQREIIVALFYHRFAARLTDEKEPMYRALRGMNRALGALRRGGFTDSQWADVQELMGLINQDRRAQRVEIHRELSSAKNQKSADKRAKIKGEDLRREWLDPQAPKNKAERARLIAGKHGDDPENILRRIRDWDAKGKLKNS